MCLFFIIRIIFVIFIFRVTVTGIYRAQPMKVNPRQRNVKAVYKTYIDVIHFRKMDKKRLYENDPDWYESRIFLISDND